MFQASCKLGFWASIAIFAATVPWLPGQSKLTLTSIEPNSAVIGSGPVNVTLRGSGFDASTVVMVYHHSGSDPRQLTPTLIDDSTLQVSIPPDFVAPPTTASIALLNPGIATSGTVSFFALTADPPTVTSISPAGGLPGTTVQVSLHGTNLGAAVLTVSGPGISVLPALPFTDSIRLQIAPDAPPGPRAVTISTAAGSTSICGSMPCTFSVVTSGSWTTVPNPPEASAPAIVRLLDGRVLVAGGAMQPSGVATSAVHIFNPVPGTWTETASMINPRSGGLASLLPGGRVLVVSSGGPAEIYTPSTQTWSGIGSAPIVSGRPLLLPNGKVLFMPGVLFNPATSRFETPSGFVLSAGSNTMELLSDGRVFITNGLQQRIWDPDTGSTIIALDAGRQSLSPRPRLLPDGRVLVQITDTLGPFAVVHNAYIFDPRANTVTSPSILGFIGGDDLVLANGSLLITDVHVGRTSMVTLEYFGSAALYDPVTDRAFPQNIGIPPLAPRTLLDDGRAFGLEYFSATGSQFSGMHSEIYTPPPYTNPAPVVASVSARSSMSGADLVSLDIRGSAFLPNSSAYLGDARLVTVYLGSEHLVAFVPAALRSSSASGITVNNPSPGGGRTDAVRIGAIATAPTAIGEVETGAIRSGYVIVTPDAGAAAPTSTLTYGMVRNGIVESQAAILPAPLTSETSMIVDFVQSAGRNLGLAIANAGGTSALVTLTLRDSDGVPVSSAISVSIPPRAQIARFISELFSTAVITSAFRGSVAIQSSIPVSIIGLRFSGAEFSTVPIPIKDVGTVPAQGSIGGVSALMFPQFAMSGGWATTLSLLNTTSASMSGRVDIFDTAGRPMAIALNGERRSTFSYALPAGASLVLAPRDANGQSPF